MAKRTDQWTTISLHPLMGGLDVRSRPADLPQAAFRWKLNMQATPEGKLCRRDGFSKAFPDKLYDNNGVPLTDPNHGDGVVYKNHDHHHQGATREPINFLYESTDSSGTRRLFDGTQSRLSLLDEGAGTWTDIVTGVGGFGARWTAGYLQDVVVFANGFNVISYDLSTSTLHNPISDLANTVGVTAAKIAIAFSGVILLMNVTQQGKEYPTRVRWCDINDPARWSEADPNNTSDNSIAGYQDLPAGDEILGAAELGGAMYIYTRRSIWRCTVATGSTDTFSFTRVYTEPKNQTGCLVYPGTLVSTGLDHFYLSRDGIYRYDPYLPAPERLDWLHRASGVIYKKADTAMSGTVCSSPVGEYLPAKRELWFSWPSGSNAVNNWTMVAQLDQKTADIVNDGFTAFANYRRVPAADVLCNESQDFIAASGTDYCLKDIGGVFYHEYATILAGNPVTDDLPLDGQQYFSEGYYSTLRGVIPLGYNDREKIIRNFLVDADVSEQDKPCVFQLKIGNSYSVVDPNDQDDICAVQWRRMTDKPVACPDGMKLSEMTAKNLKPSIGIEWRCYEAGRFLYFDLTIANPDGGPAIGADACLERIDVDVMALPKP